MFIDIGLFVPQCLNDSARKRISISKSIDFDTMCVLVYAAMECENVPKKPDLAFKLLNAVKSSAGVCLHNQDEWLDLIRAFKEVEAKNGDATANIVVSNKVCHLWLLYIEVLTLS